MRARVCMCMCIQISLELEVYNCLLVFGLIELAVGSVMFSLHYCCSELKFLYVPQIIRLLTAYGLVFDV